MNVWKDRLVTMVGSVALCAIFMVGWQVFADMNAASDQVPKLIPYNGVLEFDGVPVTATGVDAKWIQFDIYDDNSGAPQLVYSQQIQVDVYNGHFTALLGPSSGGTALQDVVGYADDLSVQLTMLNVLGDGGDDVLLSNPQRLLISPFAMWATNATDFDVASALNVGTTVTAGGNVTATDGDLSAGEYLTVDEGAHFKCDGCGSDTQLRGASDWGDLTIQGRVVSSSAALHLSPPGGSRVEINDTYRAAGGSTSSDGASLLVEGEIMPSAGGNTRGIQWPDDPFGGSSDTAWIRYYQDGTGEDAALQIGISNDSNDEIEFYQDDSVRMRIEDGNVATTGAVTVGGEFTAASNTRSSCTWSSWKIKEDTCTGCGSSSSNPPDASSPNMLDCGSARFVSAIDFTHSSDNNGTHDEWYRIYCCRL